MTRTDMGSLRGQASRFQWLAAASTRPLVYRSRWTVGAFMELVEDSAVRWDLAYSDVKAPSFQDYLTHYNRVRPFFIESNSQRVAA
jgi:hypothetical protein